MKFKHTATRDDGGGTLTVTAENQKEALEIIKHFRLFDMDDPEQVLAMAEAMKKPDLEHVDTSTKRPWFKVESSLDLEFTEPYAKLLTKLTGWEARWSLPDMDLTPFHPRRLCHTHITDTVRLEGGHICFTAFDEAGEWNGKSAADCADENCTDYICEDFGFRRHEREYIEAGNGSLKHNPNYLRRHKAQPGLGAPWFWSVLFSWWRATHATVEQRRILDGVDALKKGWIYDPDYALRKGGGEQAALVGYSLYYLNPNGTCDYDGKGTMASVIKWDDFANLAQAQAA